MVKTDLVTAKLAQLADRLARIEEHRPADEGLAPAGNLSQSFVRLHEHGVIGAALLGPIQRAVGLGNVVAHGYERVNANMVFQAATVGILDLKAFGSEVARWLAKQP